MSIPFVFFGLCGFGACDFAEGFDLNFLKMID
jgi:hypothetical protein